MHLRGRRRGHGFHEAMRWNYSEAGTRGVQVPKAAWAVSGGQQLVVLGFGVSGLGFFKFMFTDFIGFGGAQYHTVPFAFESSAAFKKVRM